MEKFSLVRRRKKIEPPEIKEDLPQDKEHQKKIEPPEIKEDLPHKQHWNEILLRKISEKMNIGKKEDPVFEEVTADKDEVVTVELTPDQSEVIQSTNYIKDLLEGIGSGVKLDIDQSEPGKIFFNFYFKPIYTVKMLTTKNVCELLQVSRSYVTKLIKTEQIKSYRIGRRRRFSLEDMLDYINKNREDITPEE